MPNVFMLSSAGGNFSTYCKPVHYCIIQIVNNNCNS